MRQAQQPQTAGSAEKVALLRQRSFSGVDHVRSQAPPIATEILEQRRHLERRLEDAAPVPVVIVHHFDRFTAGEGALKAPTADVRVNPLRSNPCKTWTRPGRWR